MAEHQGPRPLNRRELIAGAGTGILAIYLVGCGGSSSKLPDHVGGHGARHHGGGATTAADARRRRRARAAGNRRHARRQAGRRLPGGGQLQRPGDRLHRHQLGLDLQPHVRAAVHVQRGQRPAAAVRGRPAAVSADSLTYTIPLRRRRDVPQRPPGRGRGLRVRLGPRARPQANESWAASYIYTIEGAQERYEDGAKTVTGIKVVDPKTIQVTLDAARRHLPVRADAAVHGAGAEGGGREVRQGLPGARRRQRPVQADHVRPGRPDDAVRPAHRLPLARACRTSTRSSTAGASTPACRSWSCRRARPTCSPTASTRRTWRRCGATRSCKDHVFEQPLLAAALGQPRPEPPAAVQGHAGPPGAQLGHRPRRAVERVTGDTAFTFGAPFPKDLPGFPRTFQPFTLRPRQGEGAAGRGRRREDRRSTSGCRPTRPTRPKLGQILQQQWAGRRHQREDPRRGERRRALPADARRQVRRLVLALLRDLPDR